MLFSSYIFLFFYLPLTIAAYFLTPKRFKNFTLLICSLIFYAWGTPDFLLLFLLSCLLDYYLVIKIGQFADNKKLARRILACSVVANVLLLLYFKYANFFVEQASAALEITGFQSINWVQIALPVGISFFTFHKISYSVDVFRGKSKPTTNFINYLLYIAFFPQLIAGPIIRYHSIERQLLNREHSSAQFFSGFVRFSCGLAQKVLLADPLGAVADNVFSLEYSQLSTFYAWLGICCYAFQIYFDFSGYSSMAIGLARMFGFEFQENFNFPYISKSFTEFWQRWHISLSSFMKEYIYIPLGGNRVSAPVAYLNLWIVFLLSGFWHGSSWNFIVWGALHGIYLSLDKLFWLKYSAKLPAFVNRIITFILLLTTWVLFRADSISESLAYYHRLYSFYTPIPQLAAIYPDQIINNKGVFTLFLAVIFSFIPASIYFQHIADKFKNSGTKVLITLRASFAILLYLLSVLTLSASNYNPFIYFRF
jgi:alginate O-acetyltransferase complex protein AlgI